MTVEATDQGRFRVLKKDGSIELYGIMHDNIKCEIVAEFLAETNYINFKNLHTASWHGLQQFHKYLSSHIDKAFVLLDIPYQIFQYLRLIQNFSTNITLQSFHLKVFTLADNKQEISFNYPLYTRASMTQLAAVGPAFARQSGANLVGTIWDFLPKNKNFDLWLEGWAPPPPAADESGETKFCARKAKYSQPHE